MLTLTIPAAQVVLRTVVVYLAVLGGLRLMGKRELGQMNAFDLVLILLIANAVQNAMVGPDDSLPGGLIAAFTLLIVNRGVSFLRLKSSTLGRVLEGVPTVLVQNGEVILPNLEKEGVDREELEMVIREHGVELVKDVRLAVLEIDGSISIVPRQAEVTRTLRRLRQIKRH